MFSRHHSPIIIIVIIVITVIIIIVINAIYEWWHESMLYAKSLKVALGFQPGYLVSIGLLCAHSIGNVFPTTTALIYLYYQSGITKMPIIIFVYLEALGLE